MRAVDIEHRARVGEIEQRVHLKDYVEWLRNAAELPSCVACPHVVAHVALEEALCPGSTRGAKSSQCHNQALRARQLRVDLRHNLEAPFKRRTQIRGQCISARGEDEAWQGGGVRQHSVSVARVRSLRRRILLCHSF